VYLVTVTRIHESFMLDEYRNGRAAAAQFPSHIATEGLAAIDLIFHPLLSNDFAFRCEGLGRWEGRELWQVHFVQRSDRPVRIRGYNLNGRQFGLKLEGRAWIDPGNDQVVHLESELAKPVPQIELTRERLAVTYAPVKFVSTGQELWLPHEAELYVERRGKRYCRRHTFSDFRLFNVETSQTLQQPKSSYSFTNVTDQDVSGELIVNPAEGLEGTALKLRFTVPAHGRVFKIVGLGKDVNLAADAVASAKYVYKGKAGSVKVDADLVNETTLDVQPEVEEKQ
jgi:hypothetical protein